MANIYKKLPEDIQYIIDEHIKITLNLMLNQMF